MRQRWWLPSGKCLFRISIKTQCSEAFVVLIQGYTNPVRQFIRGTKFCTWAPNLCGSSVWTCYMPPICHLHSWNSWYILGMDVIFCTPGFIEILQVNLGYYRKFDHAQFHNFLYIYRTIDCHTTWPSDSSSQLLYEQERCNTGIAHDPTYLLFHSCMAVRPSITFAMYFHISKL